MNFITIQFSIVSFYFLSYRLKYRKYLYFSNAVSQCPSLKVQDPFSRPYKTTGIIIFLCVNTQIRKVPGIRWYNYVFIPKGKTVNKEMYIDILRRLRDAVRRKRSEIWRTNS